MKGLRLTLALSMNLALLVFMSPVRADPFLIVPGRSIGQTQLGRNGGFFLHRLPKPTAADASMGGNVYRVWQAKTSRDTLFIHTSRNDMRDPPRPGVTIDEIRVTSCRFHTRGGISSGAALAQIQQRFPHGKVLPENGYIYRVSRAGIAFEFAREPSPAAHCVAITVYPPGPANRLATDREVQDLLRSGRSF